MRLEVKFENTGHFVNRLRVCRQAMEGRHDAFALGVIEVRGPIRHDAIAAMRGIPPSKIADHRVVMHALAEGHFLEGADDWCLGG